MTPSGRKLARKVSTSLATVGAGQSFRSVPKEATHCLRRTNTQWTIFPGDNKQPGPPRPNSDPYQDPSAEAHHADNARHRHSPPWRLAAPHACHTATPTTGIAVPNLMLSGLCCRPMPNAAIPTVRTTTPLCRGHHRRHPHHKTPPPPPRDVLLPKRPRRLWVTDHHGADQQPAPGDRGKMATIPCPTRRR
jgi:hypothetical protein